MDPVSKLFQKTALFLAPMEGVTNSLFRQGICDIGGVDVVATEFVRITGVRQKVKPFVRHSGVPLQIQVMGTTPEVVSGCVRYLKEREVLFDSDWLDLNVGCPSRRVNASGAGAALLLDPSGLLKILEAMRCCHPGPLSMKTRVGYQSDLDFPSLLQMLADSPIDFLTLHARTKCDGYTEPANYSYLAQAVDALPYPVVGNGDVWTVNDARRMLSETGVAGVMCGRGVMQDPFLIRDIADDLRGHSQTSSVHERQEELFSFMNQLLEKYALMEPRTNAWVGRAKECLTWFSRNRVIGRELFSEIKRLQTLSDIRLTMSRYHSNLVVRP